MHQVFAMERSTSPLLSSGGLRAGVVLVQLRPDEMNPAALAAVGMRPRCPASGLTGAVAERGNSTDLQQANLALREENERLRRETRRKDDELKRLYKEMEVMKARTNELERDGAGARGDRRRRGCCRSTSRAATSRTRSRTTRGRCPADEARWALAKTIYTMIEVKLVDSAGKQVPARRCRRAGCTCASRSTAPTRSRSSSPSTTRTSARSSTSRTRATRCGCRGRTTSSASSC